MRTTGLDHHQLIHKRLCGEMGRIWAFRLALIVGFIDCANAIMCYECNSATNALCTQARLPDNLKRNCSELDRGVTHTLCRKITQHIDHEINGYLPKSRVIRSCGWDESKYKHSCYHKSGFGGRHDICTCNTDLCNVSSKLATSTVLLILNLILLKLLIL